MSCYLAILNKKYFKVGVHKVSTLKDLSSQVSELSRQVQLLLNCDIQSQELCSYCHTYGYSITGYYNREPLFIVEDVNSDRAYGA